MAEAAHPIRVTHAGVGGRGRWPLEVLGADPHFQSAALVDLSPASLDAARAITGLPESACFSSLEDALASIEADAVVICTPTKTHATLCRLGFAAGKHVLVEKGMTLDWAEANALVAEAEAAGVAFCVAQNYRYMAETRTLARLLQEGTYGAPHLVDLIHHRYRPEPRTLDYPFATVWDMGCHHFDNLVSLFGPVARVTAISHSAPWSAYRHDAGISAMLEFASGPVCTYQLTHQATLSEYRVVVQSADGALVWEDRAGPSAETPPHWRYFPKPDRHLGRNPAPVDVESAPAPRSEQGVVNDWRRAIASPSTQDQVGISGRRNLETLAVCELVVRSATQRRPVSRDEL
jgi:predicted dehydrogenase